MATWSFLMGLSRKLIFRTVLGFAGVGVVLVSCSSGSTPLASPGSQHTSTSIPGGTTSTTQNQGSSTTSTTSEAASLPSDPCSYLSLATADQITGDTLK